MPKVSVLIPTFNSASFLDEAISSVLDQTFTDFELIIVDNCSTDGSSQVIHKYLSDRRVRYFRNEENIGISRNFNKCFSLAEGEYIKCLCSDDKLHPQLLQKFVSVLDAHQEVSLVSSFFQEIDLGTKTVSHNAIGLSKGKQIIRQILSSSNFIGNPSQVMFRKECLSSLGGFKEISEWNVDLEFFFRVLTMGDCYIIPEVLSYTRVHPGAASQLLLKNFKSYFGNYDLVKSLELSQSDLGFSKMDLKKLVKRNAKECTLIIPRTIYHLKKENRIALRKALIIAYKEGVLLSCVPFVCKKFFGRFFSIAFHHHQ